MNHSQKNRTLGKKAFGVLRLGLPIITAALIICVFGISSMDTYDAARLYMRTSMMLEHIMMSLLLIVGGALLFDIAEREHQS